MTETLLSLGEYIYPRLTVFSYSRAAALCWKCL